MVTNVGMVCMGGGAEEKRETCEKFGSSMTRALCFEVQRRKEYKKMEGKKTIDKHSQWEKGVQLHTQTHSHKNLSSVHIW